MHELAVTESILEIVDRHARQANASRVTDVYLVIGQLSSIVDDSIQFYWEMIAQNTLCATSRLHFERIPARLECQDCSEIFHLVEMLSPCPKCGSNRLKILSGEEFRVDSIEVENG